MNNYVIRESNFNSFTKICESHSESCDNSVRSSELDESEASANGVVWKAVFAQTAGIKSSEISDGI